MSKPFRLIYDQQHDTINAVLRWLIEHDHLTLEAAEAVLLAVSEEAQEHAAELKCYRQERTSLVGREGWPRWSDKDEK